MSIRSGWRKAKQVRHVVTAIVAPMGPPLSARPPVPTEEERLDVVEQKRAAKDARQASKGRQVAAVRIAERDKLQREITHIERIKTSKAKRAERLEQGSLEEKVVEGEIERLAKEKAVERGKRLADAMVECKAHYTNAAGRQQAQMRRQEWFHAILDETNAHKRVLDMVIQGEGREDDAIAAGIDITEFRKARRIADQILSTAIQSTRPQRELEEQAAKFLEAEAQSGASNGLSAALEALAPSPSPTDLAAFLDTHKDALSQTTLPSTPPLEPAVPIPALLDSMHDALHALNTRSAQLAAESSGDGASTARKALLRLARTHVEGEVAALGSRVAAFERLQRVVQEHALVRENFAVFWRTLAAIGFSKAERKVIGQLFGFAHKESDGAAESASSAASETVESGGEAKSDGASGVGLDGETQGDGIADEKPQQDAR